MLKSRNDFEGDWEVGKNRLKLVKVEND